MERWRKYEVARAELDFKEFAPSPPRPLFMSSELTHERLNEEEVTQFKCPPRREFEAIVLSSKAEKMESGVNIFVILSFLMAYALESHGIFTIPKELRDRYRRVYK